MVVTCCTCLKLWFGGVKGIDSMQYWMGTARGEMVKDCICSIAPPGWKINQQLTCANMELTNATATTSPSHATATELCICNSAKAFLFLLSFLHLLAYKRPCMVPLQFTVATSCCVSRHRATLQLCSIKKTCVTMPSAVCMQLVKNIQPVWWQHQSMPEQVVCGICWGDATVLLVWVLCVCSNKRPTCVVLQVSCSYGIPWRQFE